MDLLLDPGGMISGLSHHLVSFDQRLPPPNLLAFTAFIPAFTALLYFDTLRLALAFTAD